MRTLQFLFLIAVSILGASGCSIKHVIEQDYPQYLINNIGTSNFPETDKASEYFLTAKTQQHRYEFRAVSTGYANLWIVEFGKMLDDQLMSKDVQDAFGALKKVSTQSEDLEGLLIFDLQSYTFKDYNSHISMKISLFQKGKEVFSKLYEQDGKSQGGKMFWAGAFGQKNAVQQSTKLALDEILRRLISDLNAPEI